MRGDIGDAATAIGASKKGRSERLQARRSQWAIAGIVVVLLAVSAFVVWSPQATTEAAAKAGAARVLRELADLGIDISIDDFGAGYTSLGQLKSLPVTEFKIDKSFVMNTSKDPNDALIVHSVVDLEHNLGLNIVAEGVENRAALERLAAYGCDAAQGYYLCRPISAEAFDAWRSAYVEGIRLATETSTELETTST